MFKRYSVSVSFKSGASVETFMRAHNVSDAITQVLPLFNQTDTLIAVNAREIHAQAEAPPASVKAPQVHAKKKGGRRAKHHGAPSQRAPQYAGADGQPADAD